MTDYVKSGFTDRGLPRSHEPGWRSWLYRGLRLELELGRELGHIRKWRRWEIANPPPLFRQYDRGRRSEFDKVYPTLVLEYFWHRLVAEDLKPAGDAG